MKDGPTNPSGSAFSMRLHAALERATTELLAARTSDGHWVGHLSSSALSTATAVTALALAQREAGISDFNPHIAFGLDWLGQHANADGGWGDTVLSISNLSTTTLCWASFGAVPGADEKYRAALINAEHWLTRHAGGIAGDQLARAIIQRYGQDQTFSVPILTMCALAGRLGAGREAWRHVLPLPFELAACPRSWFSALRLPVVSYALPALIAIGQARHHHSPSGNPIARLLRKLTREHTLRVLTDIQPGNGGFLEATPLTSFVTMSLAGSGQANHQVTKRGVEFLTASQRPDGSWPIDTNLATWLTTLAVNALGDVTTRPPSAVELLRRTGNTSTLSTLRSRTGTEDGSTLRPDQIGTTQDGPDARRIRSWLLSQQYRRKHPYTSAAPGGWAWTDLPGGVPDADDTAGALLALRQLGPLDDEVRTAATAGISWLLDLQNRDGGIPTFCRGWGALPFDRSSPDLTAHALRAWLAWFDNMPGALQERLIDATNRALHFLYKIQRSDGSWTPLWFGNQFETGEENPTYGTSRVLRSLVEAIHFRCQFEGQISAITDLRFSPSAQLRATQWLLETQKTDGSWGGGLHSPSSVEESALALEALAFLLDPAIPQLGPTEPIKEAVTRGAGWLIDRVESGHWTQPAAIGFYFARLWYFDRLYPMIFTVGALRRVARCLFQRHGE